MIQLLPVTEPAMIDRLNQIYHTNAAYALVCVEKKEIKASCLYDITPQGGEICNISTVEPEIFDGLARLAFQKMLEAGVDQAVFAEFVDPKMLQTLGFVQDEPYFVQSLSKIIHNCKSCAEEG